MTLSSTEIINSDEENAEIMKEGRKTFFIMPEFSSLLPESYLVDYLTKGYEAYLISNDQVCPLEKKIDIIISTFPDLIMFFFIDYIVEGIDWPTYMRFLKDKYGNKVNMGVLYTKRQNEKEKAAIERYYLYELGLQCGCIALEYQKTKNFSIIAKVMFANQACGRRKSVRAICNEKSRVKFKYANIEYAAQLCDISLSHFSCVLDSDEELNILLYERLNNIYVEMNGMRFWTDAVLLVKRPTHDRVIYVFVFVQHDGTQGIEKETLPRLIQKIYDVIKARSKENLLRKFLDAAKEPLHLH